MSNKSNKITVEPFWLLWVSFAIGCIFWASQFPSNAKITYEQWSLIAALVVLAVCLIPYTNFDD